MKNVLKKSRGFTPTPNLASRCFTRIYQTIKSKTKLFFVWKSIPNTQRKTTPKLVSGFTLIELLAVIAIIAILSTIIYASFSGAQSKSRDQKRVADISLIKLSLEAYFNKNGQYPTSTSALIPTFLPSIPTPPNGGPASGSSGNAYDYNYFPIAQDPSNPNICTTYQLWTTFENQNTYLESKEGFDSTGISTNKTITECSDGTSASPNTSVNASSNPLIYDVMPQ